MSLLAHKNTRKKEEVYFQSEMTFTPCLLGYVLLFQWHTSAGKQPLTFRADLHSLQENLSKQLQPAFGRWELITPFVPPSAPAKRGKGRFSLPVPPAAAPREGEQQPGRGGVWGRGLCPAGSGAVRPSPGPFLAPQSPLGMPAEPAAMPSRHPGSGPPAGAAAFLQAPWAGRRPPLPVRGCSAAAIPRGRGPSPRGGQGGRGRPSGLLRCSRSRPVALLGRAVLPSEGGLPVAGVQPKPPRSAQFLSCCRSTKEIKRFSKSLSSNLLCVVWDCLGFLIFMYVLMTCA